MQRLVVQMDRSNRKLSGATSLWTQIWVTNSQTASQVCGLAEGHQATKSEGSHIFWLQQCSWGERQIFHEEYQSGRVRYCHLPGPECCTGQYFPDILFYYHTSIIILYYPVCKVCQSHTWGSTCLWLLHSRTIKTILTCLSCPPFLPCPQQM